MQSVSSTQLEPSARDFVARKKTRDSISSSEATDKKEPKKGFCAWLDRLWGKFCDLIWKYCCCCLKKIDKKNRSAKAVAIFSDPALVDVNRSIFLTKAVIQAMKSGDEGKVRLKYLQWLERNISKHHVPSQQSVGQADHFIEAYRKDPQPFLAQFKGHLKDLEKMAGILFQSAKESYEEKHGFKEISR